MAKIPPLRRLDLADFKDQAGWIGNLILPLNVFFEQIVTALNKRLTLTDNFSGSLITVTIDGLWPKYLSWTLGSKPVSVVVANVVRADGATFTQNDAVYAQWQYNAAGQLEIDALPGLLPRPKQCLNTDVNTGTGVITSPLHQFTTGMKVQLGTTGAAPSGLTAGNSYFVIYVDANTFKLASTAANASAGTAITISGQGNGYHTFSPQIYSQFNVTLECKTG